MSWLLPFFFLLIVHVQLSQGIGESSNNRVADCLYNQQTDYIVTQVATRYTAAYIFSWCTATIPTRSIEISKIDMDDSKEEMKCVKPLYSYVP